MPARKSRGNSNQKSSQKKAGKGNAFLSFVTSAPVLLAIIFVITVCLLVAFWPLIARAMGELGADISSALDKVGANIVRLMGLGVIFVITAVIGLLVIIGRPSSFARHWNYYIAAAAFMTAAWGALSFLRPSGYGLLAQVTLGGYIGQGIITDSPVVGILILLALVILGTFLVAPEWTLGLFKRTAKGTAGAVGEIAEAVKESNARKKPGPAVKEQEEQPVKPDNHEEPATPADTAVMDRLRSGITVGGWSLPNINILDKIAETVISDSEIEKRRDTIEEALASYGVEAKVIEVNRGPTVTQFGVEPGWDRKFKEVREKDRDGNVSTRQEEVGRTRVKVERINSLANDLALALASAGYVVAAPMHKGDNYADQSAAGSVSLYSGRNRQLHATIDYMLGVWQGHDRIDPERVGAFGMSAGGFTVLTAVGAQPDLRFVAKHCAESPEFVCEVLGHAKSPLLLAAAPSVGGDFLADARIKAVVVAAPGLGFSFGPNGLANVRVPIQLWSADLDDKVPYATNARLIREALGPQVEFHSVPGAGHTSFLAPCGILKPPGICSDPGQFDRKAFHATMNASVVAFLDRNLPSQGSRN